MLTVLVAEDEATTRLMLTRMIERWGYRVQPAENGVQALQAFERIGGPSLAVLDWQMPEMDGIEVLRRVRQLQLPFPPYILLLTSMDNKKDMVRGLEAGADDYLVKPFDVAELQARLNVGSRYVDMQKTMLRQMEELRAASEHIRTLQDILPICVHCHSIRSDKESWHRIEDYLKDHGDVQVSHGLCPDCMRKYYPEVNDDTSVTEVPHAKPTPPAE